MLGASLGDAVGTTLGTTLGDAVGAIVGYFDMKLGDSDGIMLGNCVGV
jgi:hypothetical protein